MNKKRVLLSVLGVLFVIALVFAGIFGFVVYRIIQVNNFIQESKEVLEKADNLASDSILVIDDLENQSLTLEKVEKLRQDNQEFLALSSQVPAGHNSSTQEASKSLKEFLDDSGSLMTMALNYIELGYCYQTLENNILEANQSISDQSQINSFLIAEIEVFNTCSGKISGVSFPEILNEELVENLSQDMTSSLPQLEKIQTVIVDFRQEEEGKIKQADQELQVKLENLREKFENIQIF